MDRVQGKTDSCDNEKNAENIIKATAVGHQILKGAVQAAAVGDMPAFTRHLAKALKTLTENGLIVPKYQGTMRPCKIL